jgi:transcription initiation factor IIE alpha subunit
VDFGDDGLLGSKCGYDISDFVKRGYSALAFNLEKCGRHLDAAKIYEEQLKMYEEAKLLREKDKQMIVKRTEVSINLNELLKQIKDGGIVAVYRCPNCNGTLKINNKTSLKSLKTCEHCGSEIETVDLADFLKTALS